MPGINVDSKMYLKLLWYVTIIGSCCSYYEACNLRTTTVTDGALLSQHPETSFSGGSLIMCIGTGGREQQLMYMKTVYRSQTQLMLIRGVRKTKTSSLRLWCSGNSQVCWWQAWTFTTQPVPRCSWHRTIQGAGGAGRGEGGGAERVCEFV